MKKATILLLAAGLLVAVSIPAVQAQQQEQPKEKKKPRKVWTEDDLAGLSGRINVVGVEAPPPAPPGQPAAGGAPADGSAIWEELDMLTQQRQTTQEQLDLNRRHVEAMTAKLNAESDPANIDELLQGRVQKEEEVARLEAELEQLNLQIAELERQTRGRKRPAKTRVKAEQPVKQRPAAEGEETPAEEPPKEEPPAEEPPPPPPPPSF